MGDGRQSGSTHYGIVVERLPDTLYAVKLEETKQRIVAHILASRRRNFVRLLPGDRVTVELTTRNRSRGRVVRRDTDRYQDVFGSDPS